MVNAKCADQRIIITNVIGVAIVGHPRSHDRIKTRNELARQSQVDVIEHVQKLMRARIHIGHRIADEQHVRRRVLARHRRHAARQAHEAQHIRNARAIDVDPSIQLLSQIRRAAHVHP